MTALIAVLAVLAVLISGVAAGGLVNVLIAQVPTFRALTPSDYVTVKQMVHVNTKRYLPWLFRACLLPGIALVALRTDPLGRALAIGGVVHIIIVAVISERFNQPLNREVQSWSPAQPPAELDAVRTRWAKFNLIRTINAVVALALFAACAVLPQ
jgi:uncharacterized membrane protein